MKTDAPEHFYIVVSDGVEEQTRSITCTRNYAEALVERMWLDDEMGYSFYLCDDYGNELCAFES